jgi:hypothetical protein
MPSILKQYLSWKVRDHTRALGNKLILSYGLTRKFYFYFLFFLARTPHTVLAAWQDTVHHSILANMEMGLHADGLMGEINEL